MMQIKFNFNNFIFSGVCLPQLGSVPHTPSSLAAVIGLSNNDVVFLRSYTLRALRRIETPLYTPTESRPRLRKLTRAQCL